MRWKLILPVAGLCLLVALGSAVAASIAVDETDLQAGGDAYEVNLGGDGLLYVSDSVADQVWVIDPATSSYTRYNSLNSATDARPNAAGDLWFTDSATVFGTVDVSAGTVTRWDIFNPSVEHNLSGVAFDASDRVWISEWFGSASNLYRFDPASTELCTYDVPGGSISDYVLHRDGTVWLANWSLDRIYQINPATNQATYWSLPSGRPQGMAFDGSGNLWWADSTAAVLRQLAPGSGQLSTYALPTGTKPRMVAVAGDGLIWYTEDGSGTLGTLDPAAETPTVTTPATSTTAVPVSCETLGAGTSVAASTTSGTLPWTGNSWTTIYDAGGWTVYELPTGGSPYGVSLASGYTWVADQGRQKLARTTGAAPLAAPAVSIAASGVDAVLSWDAVPNAESYQVWFSASAYFAPGDPGSDSDSTANTSYPDAGVLDQAGGRYYYVRSAAGEQVSPLSNHVAKFSFSLVPGSP